MYYTLENFINWCDEMKIDNAVANEGFIDRFKTRFAKVVIKKPQNANNYTDYETGLKFKGVPVGFRCNANEEEIEEIRPVLKKIIITLDKVFDKEYKQICERCLEELGEDGDWAYENNPVKNISDLKKCMIMDVVSIGKLKNGMCWIEVWFNAKGKNINSRFYLGHSMTLTFAYNNGKIEYHGDSLEG